MSQNNQRWYRDPVWQFVGVVVAVLSLLVTIYFSSHITLPSPSVVPGTSQPAFTSTPSSIATNPSPTPVVKPTTTATYWGLLAGDAITVNKTLTCGVGCPDPLHVRIDTIQINKANNDMTWDILFFDPTSTVRFPSFDTFALQSDITPETQATQNQINSTGSLQAIFPFAPAPNDTYTLIVTASYQTVSQSGGTSINSSGINFSPVQMLFNP